MSTTTPQTSLNSFLTAATKPYSPLPTPLTPSTAISWDPPFKPGVGGHRGRYLWTDAFGVLNFITLSRLSNPAYLILATRLVETVHSVLGRTRDRTARLQGASDAHPLAGGLRIGKLEEEGKGMEGDGMYHHYITLWMFALCRLAKATGERGWVERAVELGRATNRLFVKEGEGGRKRLVWKVGTDGRVLVGSEGRLDAATGYVVYLLLARTAKDMELGEGVLEEEIAEYQALMGRHGGVSASRDVLDLGMGLWMASGCREEEWARRLGEESMGVVKGVLRGVMGRPAGRRLAFREFGTCLGLECWGGMDEELRAMVEEVKRFWEAKMEVHTEEDLRPISWVMYAAALVPGAWKPGFLEDNGE